MAISLGNMIRRYEVSNGSVDRSSMLKEQNPDVLSQRKNRLPSVCNGCFQNSE